MQPNASIEAYNPKARRWDRLANIGDGAGHIGFVQTAKYDKKGGFWLITLRSANWSGQWDQSRFEQNNCGNVSDSLIRVYNGAATSYWREKK